MADALRLWRRGELSPHDMRRALATHGPDILAMKDEDTKKVMNLAPGRAGTSRHCAFHESIPDKVAVLERWEGWLSSLMLDKAPHAGVWPGFLPRVQAGGGGPVLLLAAS